MVKTIKKLIFATVVLVLSHACITSVDIDLPLQNSIVINGLLVPGDTISVTLHRSGVNTDTTDFGVINDAQVTLFENNTELEELHYMGNKLYLSSYTAKELTSYKIEVKTSEGEIAWAETTTPEIDFGVEIMSNEEIDNTQYNYWPYYIKIEDNSDIINNYWICDLHSYLKIDSTVARVLAYSLKTTSLLADRFNVTYDPEASIYSFEYDYFIHFSDLNITGDTLSFDFVPPRGLVLLGSSKCSIFRIYSSSLYSIKSSILEC